MIDAEIETQDLESKYYNIQAEYLYVGCLYQEPDLYLMHGDTIRPTYDFYDEATRFFFNMFKSMYKNFSQDFSEINIANFVTMDGERYKTYQRLGGYETIRRCMSASNVEDELTYYNLLKKYSVIRYYKREGFPVDKIIGYKNFPSMTAQDVGQLMTGAASKINTTILCDKESVVINKDMVETQDKYLVRPQMGLTTPWPGYNEMFRGCRKEKVIFDGALSNEGKTRKMLQLAAHITLVEDETFLLLSNEMSEEDIKTCFLTTVINNEEYKQFHGVDITKPESEIVLGQYREDKSGLFLTRNPSESVEDFKNRVYECSEEYRKVKVVSEWVDQKREKNLLFKDMGNDYSDKALEMTIKKHKELYGVRYVGYDTLKGYRVDDWQTVKQTATMLKELMKKEQMFMYAVFQLTDDTVFCDVFDLTSNNIANAKQLKHVADHLVLNMRINKKDYGKYRYLPYDDSEAAWGVPKSLDPNRVYYGAKIDKNRAADKSKLLLFEVDLNTNIWNNVGVLIKKTD